MHRPGQRVGLGPLLQHDDRPAQLAEQDGQRTADGAVADDRDLRVDVHAAVHAGTRSGLWPHTLMLS